MSEQSQQIKAGVFWCYPCASYQHVRRSGLSAGREHHHNFRCVSCEKKENLISSEATTLSHAKAVWYGCSILSSCFIT